jgi:predicted acylesterase/phospholipase RssA
VSKRHIILGGVGIVVAAVIGGAQLLPDRQPYPPLGGCAEGLVDVINRGPFSELDLDRTSVGLAASGGGSRAAYLAAAVLREIRRSGLAVRTTKPTGDITSLLDQIDLISSVSGGSLASTYFVKNFEKLRLADAESSEWTDFLDRMAFSYRADLTRSALLRPASWIKWLFTDYNRGSLARERYDELLFRGATIADLPERPALYVNAFDIANHVRFIFSKHVINTVFFQPPDWWGTLNAPRELVTANDMTFAKIDPSSVRLADAVYASSAFPIAYPNMALKYCGSGILFQGRQVFLADGAMADNTGLITLLTQMRAALADLKPRTSMLALAIDASLDRLGGSGSVFEDRGIEKRYAWKDTIFGHANESIYAAIELLQDAGWKFLENSGVVTDQLNANWAQDLNHRSGRCIGERKSSWAEPFETGQLRLRPLVIRLGLRDVLNPDFMMRFAPADTQRSNALQSLIEQNDLPDGLAPMSIALKERITNIRTDFALTDSGRKTLDLAAFLLVHGKLAADLAAWNSIVAEAGEKPLPEAKCLN